MKSGFIHVCFVIDKSGSMCGSIRDVKGGFKSVIEEQKKNSNGSCSISLYTFDDVVKEVYKGKDVNTINTDLDYLPGGCTAMNDGIGTAIDKIGEWLSAMPEEERPEKNLIVIMTDGYENSSKEYTYDKVKDMIKEQTDKYNWSFVYLGTDISETSYADGLGVMRGCSTRSKFGGNYDFINSVTNNYRNYDISMSTEEKNMLFCASVTSSLNSMNEEYKNDTGINI